MIESTDEAPPSCATREELDELDSEHNETRASLASLRRSVVALEADNSAAHSEFRSELAALRGSSERTAAVAESMRPVVGALAHALPSSSARAHVAKVGAGLFVVLSIVREVRTLLELFAP